MRFLALALLAFLPSADLDVAVPPGTPLEWHRELSRPVPTGHRGRTPVPTEYVKTATAGSTPGSTVVLPAGPVKTPGRPVLEYSVVNAMDIFEGTSSDCPSHLRWGTPPQSKPGVTQDDVATEGGFVLRHNYPPVFPAELIWVGITAALREYIHPRAISWAETAAYCVEIGEPALAGVAMGEGRIKGYLAGISAKLPPKPPDIPKHADPRIAGLYNLAAVELSGGFPHALDPTFARRTLALGDDMYDAVLECCRSAHPFLARNAVFVLGGYPQSTPDLVKLWKDSKDRTFRMRALRALAERREASIVKDLADSLSVGDLPMTSAALHALGLIGDAAAEGAVVALVCRDPKKPAAADNVDWTQREILWSAIPALGRMKAAKDLLAGMEAHLRKKTGGKDDAKAEDPDPEKLFHQMCLVALVHHGEKGAVDEAVRRVKEKGVEGFPPATHYALIDALAASPEGAEALKLRSPGNRHVRLALLEALVKNGRITAAEMERVALRADEMAAVRARAVQLLLDLDGPTARTACSKILGDFAKAQGPIEAGAGLLAGAAAQVGGFVDAPGAPVLHDAAKRAFEMGCFARREGNNETNLKETRIVMFPALLETLLIELGRTGSASAIPLLKRVVARRQVPQGRAEAVVAAGAIAGKEADQILIDALSDKDGWVRFLAYRALASRSGQDHFASWIWLDNPSAARKSINAYKDWFKKRYPD